MDIAASLIVALRGRKVALGPPSQLIEESSAREFVMLVATPNSTA